MKTKTAPVIPNGPVFHDDGNDEAIEAPEEHQHVPNDPESIDQSEEYLQNVIQVQPALPQNCAIHI